MITIISNNSEALVPEGF